jgi:hypothetical protein
MRRNGSRTSGRIDVKRVRLSERLAVNGTRLISIGDRASLLGRNVLGVLYQSIIAKPGTAAAPSIARTWSRA